MPQWDFLDYLAGKGSKYSGFELVRRAEVTGLIEEGARVIGVRAQTPEGPLEMRTDVVIGADGRHSAVRDKAGLEAIAMSPPMDVLWFRLSRHPGETMPFFKSGSGRVLICINRGEYWQIAYVIPSGSFPEVRAAGLDEFRASISALLPAFTDRVREVGDWSDVQRLSVRVDRLRRWYRPGLLCIGDAAHAMSPACGVGINLAIQDAVATANMLGPAFGAGGSRSGRPTPDPASASAADPPHPGGADRVGRSLYPKNPHTDDSGHSPMAFRLFRLCLRCVI